MNTPFGSKSGPATTHLGCSNRANQLCAYLNHATSRMRLQQYDS